MFQPFIAWHAELCTYLQRARVRVCIALLPYPQQSSSEGAQYISSVFESQVYAYSANMSFAITVKSVNISQQNRDLLINVYKNFNIKIVDVFANQKSFTTIC